MFKQKALAAFLLVMAILFAQVGTVFAAPPLQETTSITGIIDNISVETDANNEPVVVVTLTVEGVPQTVNLSVEQATELGLLQLDPVTNEPVLDPETNLPLPDETVYGQEITIEPTEEEPTEETVHPIATILASAFGVDAAIVNGYHEDGFGFGVIAQALWIAQGLEENNPDIDAGMILQAKRDKDFSAFVLPDGSTPTNWGQFKNAATGKDKKNLGIIVSGHVDPLDDTTVTNQGLTTQQNHGNGRNNKNNRGNGNGHGRP